MYTSAECRAYAKAKLAQAEHDDGNRNRLIAAAEAWLCLASQLETSRSVLRARNTLKKNHGVIDRAVRVRPAARLQELP